MEWHELKGKTIVDTSINVELNTVVLTCSDGSQFSIVAEWGYGEAELQLKRSI